MLKGLKQRSFRYADYGVPDEHTTPIVSSNAFLDANPKQAAAFAQATRAGYQFAVDHAREAGELLVAADKDTLTNPAPVHASLKALNDGHFLKSAAGAIGTIDKAKMEAMGGYLFASAMLLDGNGKALTEKPDFSAYFSNDLLA